jgi:hypothetical protein
MSPRFPKSSSGTLVESHQNCGWEVEESRLQPAELDASFGKSDSSSRILNIESKWAGGRVKRVDVSELSAPLAVDVGDGRGLEVAEMLSPRRHCSRLLRRAWYEDWLLSAWPRVVSFACRGGRPNGRPLLVTQKTPTRRQRSHVLPSGWFRGHRSFCSRHRSQAYLLAAWLFIISDDREDGVVRPVRSVLQESWLDWRT